MSGIVQKLAGLGLSLPARSTPSANYVGHVQLGNLLIISGQICEQGGVPGPCGVLGADLSNAQGYAAAQLAALGLLAQIDAATEGDLSRVRRIVRLGVFIASAANFKAHSEVADGASDLLVAVFGVDVGKHTRTSVGVAALPVGVAVEVEAMIELRNE